METLILLNLACALFMTGLVWFVQIVHYPLFDRVTENTFPAFELDHQKRTLCVVAGPMILEGITGAMLLVGTSPGPARVGAVLGFLLLMTIWGSTYRYQAPEHFALVRAFHPALHRALVRHNWIRTVAWSLRSVLLSWMLLIR